MKITSTYSVRLRNFNRVFDDTVEVYRHAVDYFIELVIANWNTHFANLSRANDCIRVAESLSVRTKKRLMTPYNFCHDFVKFPSYLRRAAIKAAYGQVSSYQTRLAQWKAKPGQKGRQPGLPKAGRSFPVMYRDNTFIRAGRNSVKLKVRIRNTWDWVDVELDKHDVDYIALHCAARNELSPALRKRGKKWYLDFSFEEKVILKKVSLDTQLVLSVDLGINNACVCSFIDSRALSSADVLISCRYSKTLWNVPCGASGKLKATAQNACRGFGRERMVSTRTLPSRRPTSSQELRTNSRSTSLSWNTLISRAVNAARNVSDSITGEPSLSRRWWSTRRTGAESAFVASVLGTRRSLPLTAPVSLQETRTTTACVRFRQASAIRATCLLRTT